MENSHIIQSVKDKKQMEEVNVPNDSLLELSPDFKLLFESQPGLCLVVLPDAPKFTIVAASKFYLQHTSTEIEKIIGRGVFEVFPMTSNESINEGMKKLEASFHKVIEKKIKDDMGVIRYDIKKNGSNEFEDRYWRPMNMPVLDGRNEIRYIINQVEDVTNLVQEKENAQIALRKSESLFKLLVENLPIGVWLVDNKGQIFGENPAAVKIWGGSGRIPIEKYGELQGWAYDTGKKVEFHEWASTRAIEKGEVSLNEVIKIRKFDGTFGVILNSAAPIKDEKGQIIGALVQNQDIAEQKKIESEQKFQLSVSKILAESLELDTTKIGQLLIPTFADCCVFYSQDEKKDLRLEFVAHRDPEKAVTLEKFIRKYPTKSKYFRSVAEVLKNEKPIMVSSLTNEELLEAYPELQAREMYLSLTIKSFISVPVIARGKLLGAVTLCFNDSGRHFDDNAIPFCEEFANALALALDKARLYREARDAIGIREDVLAMVSHDLQNPLSVIMMSLKILQSQEFGDSEKSKRAAKAMMRIKHSTEIMRGLIARILDFAKIQAGTFAVNLKEENAVLVIEDFLESACMLAEERSLKIINAMDADLPVIICDRERLIQVFSNLIGNAIKFTPKGGTITVRAQEAEGQVYFTIEDTGKGIAADQLPHIFDRFWQVEHSANHGVGLGLAIAKGIIEAHSGKIWAESVLGVGTSFHFALPASATQSKQEPQHFH